jgi:hypothetical protein
MRLRGLRLAALAFALGASLIHNSIPSASPSLYATSILDSRLLPESPRDGVDEPTIQEGDDPWAVLLSSPDAAGMLQDRFPEADGTVALTVAIGGDDPQPVLTNADTVDELLHALDVEVDAQDRIRPDPDTPLFTDMTLVVVEIRRVIQVEEAAIPFDTLVRYSSDLDRGSSQLLQAGEVGAVQRTFQVTLRNGEEARSVLLSEEVVSEPVSQIIVQGVGQPPQPEGTVQYGQASWYKCPDEGDYAAHLTIPFGTRVTVTSLAGGEQATVVINDRGPYGVAGRIIDLCSSVFASLAPLAQGVVDVKITW